MYQIHRLMVERRGGLPFRLLKGAAFLLRFRRCGLRGRLLLRCTLLRYSIRLGLLCLGGIRRRVEHDHRQAGLFQHLGLRGTGGSKLFARACSHRASSSAFSCRSATISRSQA